MIKMLSDILNLAKLRCKMFLHSKSAIIAFGISAVVSIFVVMTFLDSAEEKSNIPIGVVDNDNTQKSKEFVKQLQEDKIFSVKFDSFENVEKELLDGNIFSVFVIEKGFEKKLLSGDNKKLIKDYYIKDNDNVKILSDIVLSKILKDVCVVYTSSEYKKYGKKYDIMSDEKYKEFINSQYEEDGKLFSFDFEIVNTKKDEDVTENVKNSILYRQVIVAIVGIFVAFVVLFAANMIISDKRYATNIRLNISLINKVGIFLGDLLGLFFISGIFTLIVSYFIVNKLGFYSKEQIIGFIIASMLYTIVIDLIFIILCIVVKEPITFQIAGAMIIIILSVVGVFNMFSFLLPGNVINITKKTPMAMFNKAFVDLTINKEANQQISGIFISIVILFILGLIIQMVKGEDNKYEL